MTFPMKSSVVESLFNKTHNNNFQRPMIFSRLVRILTLSAASPTSFLDFTEPNSCLIPAQTFLRLQVSKYCLHAMVFVATKRFVPYLVGLGTFVSYFPIQSRSWDYRDFLFFIDRVVDFVLDFMIPALVFIFRKIRKYIWQHRI